jgi:hypothetical protein
MKTIDNQSKYDLHVRTYVCMYVCMHVCMDACMYVCMYVCIYVCVYVCACVRAYVCRLCLYVCSVWKIYIYIYIYIHVYIYSLVAREMINHFAPNFACLFIEFKKIYFIKVKTKKIVFSLSLNEGGFCTSEAKNDKRTAPRLTIGVLRACGKRLTRKR